MDENLEQLARAAASDPTDVAAARRYDAALARTGRVEELRERFRFKFLCPVLWSDLTGAAPRKRFCGECGRSVNVAEDMALLVEHVRRKACVAVPLSKVSSLIDDLARDPSLHSAREADAPCIVSGAPVPVAVPQELRGLVGRRTARRLGFAPLERHPGKVFVAIYPAASAGKAAIARRLGCEVETTLVSRAELDALVASLPDVVDRWTDDDFHEVTDFHRRAKAELERNNPREAARILGDALESFGEDGSPIRWAPFHVLRGQALALAGGAADAQRARVELARAHHSDGAYPYSALWLAALFGELTPLESRARASNWPAPIAAFLLGEISAAELASRTRDAVEGCEAHCFMGVALERDGRPVEARAAYERCVALGVTYHDAHVWALLRIQSSDPAPWRT
jgi:hypothetical protein